MRATEIVGLLLSVGLAVTLGCGESGGGGTAGSGGAAGTLQLVQTVPADMASEVPTDIVVTAEFDSALNEATVTTAIESVSGQTLDMSQTWGFRTRDGEWGDPVLIEISNAGSASDPQVAADPNGNAVAVWTQSDGTRFNIWANRFD